MDDLQEELARVMRSRPGRVATAMALRKVEELHRAGGLDVAQARERATEAVLGMRCGALADVFLALPWQHGRALAAALVAAAEANLHQ